MNKRSKAAMQRALEHQRTAASIWATITPDKLTEPEARRAVRRLFRFALAPKNWMMDANASPANRANNWPTLVRMCAGTCQYIRDGHNSVLKVSKMELLMVREVIKRGYLDGRLRDKPKVKPALNDKRKARVKVIDKLLKKWDAKVRRANNAMQKLMNERKRILIRMEGV